MAMHMPETPAPMITTSGSLNLVSTCPVAAVLVVEVGAVDAIVGDSALFFTNPNRKKEPRQSRSSCISRHTHTNQDQELTQDGSSICIILPPPPL
jgi:hypothetical protein